MPSVEVWLGVCGGISRVVAEVATNPLNVVKTMVQQREGPAALAREVRRAPLRTMTRGMGAQALSAPVVGAGNFWALETTRKHLADGFCGDFVAAGVGTLVSIGFSQPFSVLNDSVLSGRSANLVQALRQPWRAFVSPRTYLAIAFSKVPNQSLMWSLSELLRKRGYSTTAASASAAFIAVCLTAPLDTVKVRFTTGALANTTPAHALFLIARHEGPLALFRAAPARCLAVVPMYAIQFHVYHALKARVLQRRRGDVT